MSYEQRTVTLKGNSLGLEGNVVQVGQAAPDFVVQDNTLSKVTVSQASGKVRILVSVPSLDTPVCDTEVRKFNQQAAGLGDDVEILVISMDLPFAQTRWCGNAGVERVKTYSDHTSASFGTAYGVLISDLHLLARAAFVVDKDGVVRHIQLVEEVGNEPDYDAILNAAKQLL